MAIGLFPVLPPGVGFAHCIALLRFDRVRLQKAFPDLLRVPIQVPPERLFQIGQEMLVLTFAIGCKAPLLGIGFSLLGQSQLTTSRVLHNRNYVTSVVSVVSVVLCGLCGSEA